MKERERREKGRMEGEKGILERSIEEIRGWGDALFSFQIQIDFSFKMKMTPPPNTK